jgi:cytochrome c2
MSRTSKKKISKKNLIKALKGEFEEPTWTQETLSEYLEKPMTQEEWLRGYRAWKKKMRENNC